MPLFLILRKYSCELEDDELIRKAEKHMGFAFRDVKNYHPTYLEEYTEQVAAFRAYLKNLLGTNTLTDEQSDAILCGVS